MLFEMKYKIIRTLRNKKKNSDKDSIMAGPDKTSDTDSDTDFSFVVQIYVGDKV